MNLAIVSPGKNLYSETFIQAHKNIQAEKVFFYYGGRIPTFLEGEGPVNISKDILTSKKNIIKLVFKINPYRYFRENLSIKEHLFAQSLRKNKIDVVLAEFGPTGVSCKKVCKKLNIPLITHFHGYDISSELPKYKNDYIDLIKDYPYVVGVSKEMIRKLLSLGASTDNVVYSPCGPNSMFFLSKPKHSGKRFISVGRFVDKKAPYYTILAFNIVLEKHPDATLAMVGTGPLLNTCKNLVKYLGLSENIEFLGVKTPLEIQKLHEVSIAYVQHSITADNGDQEGTPVGVMEASASSLPVIATTHAGIKDVVHHNSTGLLSEEHDIEGMARNMIWILENYDEACKMGERGRNLIKTNYTLEKHISTLSQLVRKAYNNSKTTH